MSFDKWHLSHFANPSHMSEPIDVKNICLQRILRNDIFVYLYDRKNFMSLFKKKIGENPRKLNNKKCAFPLLTQEIEFAGSVKKTIRGT